MAVRITHVNNSSGHDGTYVYRSTGTMDPQALPAPIADAPPATGSTFEYIDNTELADGTYYYRTQDHEGGQVSLVSDEVSITIATDFSSVSIGDPVEGGYYAGTVTYADDRAFHLIVADIAADVGDLKWKTVSASTAGAQDLDDGKANTEAMVAEDITIHPAGQNCVNYSNEGYTDWYLPSKNEMAVLYQSLDPNSASTPANFQDGGDQAFNNSGEIHWTSTEVSANTSNAYIRRFSDGIDATSDKASALRRSRPVRRVAV